jgi:HlyD family secretion protein
MTRLRRHASVLAILRVFGVTAMILGTAWPIGSQETTGSPNGDKGAGWQAVAPGLVEPVSGEIKIMAPVVGRISRVAVAVDDRVVAGEPVLHLDDEEARARVATARAQIAIRERVRNDQSAGKGENRRNAEDDVAGAEETLINARAAFDVAALAKRDGSGSDAAVATAHAAWMRAQDNIDRQRARLRKLESESGTPLPTQKEGDLQVARSELELAVAQLEKLTIRSPIAGTVLQVNVKVGEVAAPTASQPLILLGDVSRLRVRAELDEHDVGKVAAGGSVVVRANAFRGREFAGKVSAIAPIVRPGRISSPASGHLTDFSVNEILIELDDPGPLLVGMKVDVYFHAPK